MLRCWARWRFKLSRHSLGPSVSLACSYGVYRSRVSIKAHTRDGSWDFLPTSVYLQETYKISFLRFLSNTNGTGRSACIKAKRIQLNESLSRIIGRHVSPLSRLPSVLPSFLSFFLPFVCPSSTADRKYTVRGRFVITRGTDMADRFWRLALCWICIVEFARANGEQ
jgi:hypothetical protein